MSLAHPNPAPTVGQIARRLRVQLHQVEYVIKSRGLQPLSIAGNARVFSEADVERIASELRRIASSRGAD